MLRPTNKPQHSLQTTRLTPTKIKSRVHRLKFNLSQSSVTDHRFRTLPTSNSPDLSRKRTRCSATFPARSEEVLQSPSKPCVLPNRLHCWQRRIISLQVGKLVYGRHHLSYDQLQIEISGKSKNNSFEDCTSQPFPSIDTSLFSPKIALTYFVLPFAKEKVLQPWS
jgi:hypothetical protein